MPMHDWKRVPPTIYHHFHQQWTISICNALNAGLLPPGYSALVEQYSSGLYPDVLAVQRRTSKPSNPRTETTTLEAPRTRMIVHPREGRFHERANRVVIRHHLGDVVCAIEVVSPGSDKTDRVDKMGEYASAGIPFYWLVWITDNRVASIDVYVLDHAVEASRLLRTLAPEDEVSVLEVPVRIKVPWNQLSTLVR